MTDFSAALQQQLRAITAECRAQVLIARQRLREDAPRYRVQAVRFKTLAATTRLPKVQASRLRIAASYERLAELAEGSLGSAELGEHPAQGSARRARLQSDDRRSATAALLALSRALCDVTAALTRETREKLRDRPTADRVF